MKFPFFWFLHFWNVRGAFFIQNDFKALFFLCFQKFFTCKKMQFFVFFIWKMDLFFPFFLLSFFSDIKPFKALKPYCRPFPYLASVFALYGLFLPCWQRSTSQSSLFFSIEKEKRSIRSIFFWKFNWKNFIHNITF